MKKVKQIVKQSVNNCGISHNNGLKSYSGQRSSVVEQRFRKPPVKSSTLFAGSTKVRGINYA